MPRIDGDALLEWVYNIDRPKAAIFFAGKPELPIALAFQSLFDRIESDNVTLVSLHRESSQSRASVALLERQVLLHKQHNEAIIRVRETVLPIMFPRQDSDPTEDYDALHDL